MSHFTERHQFIDDASHWTLKLIQSFLVWDTKNIMCGRQNISLEFYLSSRPLWGEPLAPPILRSTNLILEGIGAFPLQGIRVLKALSDNHHVHCCLPWRSSRTYRFAFRMSQLIVVEWYMIIVGTKLIGNFYQEICTPWGRRPPLLLRTTNMSDWRKISFRLPLLTGPFIL